MTEAFAARRTLARRAALSLFAFLIGFGASVAAVHLSQADGAARASGTSLGTIDIDEYCRRNHGEAAIPVLIRRDVSGWQCAIRTNGIFGTVLINYDLGCSQQFGQVAYGDSSDLTWPYLWQCVAGPPPVG